MLYNFLKRAEKVSERVEKIFNHERDSLRYLFITSCIYKFISEINDAQMESFIKTIITNQAVAWDDQHLCNMMDCMHMHLREPLPKSPTIFCAFHFSSYRLGVFKLLSLGRRITVVASEDIIRTQGDLIAKYCGSISKSFTNKIINANSPFSVRQMLRELQNGNDLFVYIDGNTGTDGMSRINRNLAEINLLNHKILVRTGVALLSYLSQCPIVPVIVCRYNNDWPVFEVYPQLFPDNNTDKKTFCDNTMNKLYSILNNYLQLFPEQWEPWLYLYKFIPPVNCSEKKIDIYESRDYTLNEKRYIFISDPSGCKYLFDKKDISAITLTPEEYLILSNNKTLNYIEHGSSLNRFIAMEVLI